MTAHAPTMPFPHPWGWPYPFPHGYASPYNLFEFPFAAAPAPMGPIAPFQQGPLSNGDGVLLGSFVTVYLIIPNNDAESSMDPTKQQGIAFDYTRCQVSASMSLAEFIKAIGCQQPEDKNNGFQEVWPNYDRSAWNSGVTRYADHKEAGKIRIDSLGWNKGPDGITPDDSSIPYLRLLRKREG